MKVTKKMMLDWLKSGMTDLESYDPRDDMDDGEHGFGAILRRQGREEQNEIIEAIIEAIG